MRNFWRNLSLQTKTLLSLGITLILMLTPLAVWSALGERDGIIRQAEHEAGTTLDMLASIHTHAMLNRTQTEDSDPVIAMLNGTMNAFSNTLDQVTVWMVMGEKIIAYQKKNGHEEIEEPKDAIDRQVLRTGQAVFHNNNRSIIRVSRPVILGEGTASDEKCITCHAGLMGVQLGETFGGYSAAVNIAIPLAAWRQKMILLSIFGVGILFTLLFVIYARLHKSVINPLTRLVSATKDVRAHSFSLDADIASRKDIIGDLAASVRDFHKAVLEKQKLVLENLEEKKHTAMAQAASKAKSEFLAMMSHEIRTPMNGVIGMTEAILNSDISDEHRKKMNVIKQSANALMVILNDILDISKVESGKMTLEERAFVLEDVINSTLALWKEPIEQKGLELKAEIEGDITGEFMGDEVRLGQILSNLLSNACKFTEQGHVKLHVIARESDVKIAFEFRIEDTGQGIDRSKVARVFQPFSQADQTITRRYGGTGLGLPICVKLADLMSGTLKYDGGYEDGAAFVFKVELTKANATEITLLQVGENLELASRRLRLLVAEDNINNQKVLQAILDQDSYELCFANNGQEAVEIATNERFDVILMDIQMPKMGGEQAARLIRSSGGPNEDTPIIALTANAMAGDRRKYLAAGMNGFVPKPINTKDLIISIATTSHSTLDNDSYHVADV
ncbi:MAG: hypothetical protein COA85_06075 [Robiginitomaculum sp.]|nr:MAG: hypothetical protein COA85_06075 [Robiginitomaculum sp.]